jgi:hypothetical protein
MDRKKKGIKIYFKYFSFPNSHKLSHSQCILLLIDADRQTENKQRMNLAGCTTSFPKIPEIGMLHEIRL